MTPLFVPGFFGHVTASWHLFLVSLRRLLWARQTIVCVMLLTLAALAVVAWAIRRERLPEQFVEQIFLPVYVTFLLPIFCLSYATAGIASDRDEQTLVYLLMTPLPRPWIFLSKSAASMLLALAWTMGALWLICWIAGSAGLPAWHVLWPGIGWTTVAYVALFLLLSVLFRRATIIALGYALFLETLVGNMPGIAKRLAISFYTRCLIFDATAEFGVMPSGPGGAELFVPIAAATAQSILYLLCGGLLLAGLWVFSRSEYAK